MPAALDISRSESSVSYGHREPPTEMTVADVAAKCSVYCSECSSKHKEVQRTAALYLSPWVNGTDPSTLLKTLATTEA